MSNQQIEFPKITPETYAILGGGGVDASGLFRIALRQIEGGSWQRGVSPETPIYKEFGSGSDSQPVELICTGTLASDSPSEDDPGWVSTEAGDEIWVEIAFGTWPEISTVSIKSKKIDDDWGGGEIEHDGSTDGAVQTKARVKIGKVVASGESLTVRQFVTSPRRLGGFMADGYDTAGNKSIVDALWPFPA